MICATLIAQYRQSLGGTLRGRGNSAPHLREEKMNTKIGGYAIYDAQPALKKFLEARASGLATKEILLQLGAAAMAEQQADRLRAPREPREPGGVVIQMDRARRQRNHGKQ